jgi:hypothetical protein
MAGIGGVLSASREVADPESEHRPGDGANAGGQPEGCERVTANPERRIGGGVLSVVTHVGHHTCDVPPHVVSGVVRRPPTGGRGQSDGRSRDGCHDRPPRAFVLGEREASALSAVSGMWSEFRRRDCKREADAVEAEHPNLGVIRCGFFCAEVKDSPVSAA